MTEPTPEALSTRFAHAIGALGRLQKDKRNEHSRYDYLSEEAVKAAVSKVVAEFDLAPFKTRFEVLSDVWRAAKQGEQNIIKLRCILEWAGDQVCEGLGCGIDYGDKAILKAQTSAIREAWKNRFIIATGHDPEADEETDKAGPSKSEPAPAPAPKRGAKAISAGQQQAFIDACEDRAHNLAQDGVAAKDIGRNVLDAVGAAKSGEIKPADFERVMALVAAWDGPIGG